jgi:flagellar motor protein MotB
MARRGSHRLLTWIAFADFFVALSVVAIALYGFQQQQNFRITEPVKNLAEQLAGELAGLGIDVNYDRGSAALTMPDTFLFESGGYVLRDRLKLHNIASALRKVTNDWHGGYVLVIRGHTDAYPPRKDARFRSNLELSTLRARAMQEALEREGIVAPRFQIATQGVGEFEPQVDNCVGSSPVIRVRCDAAAKLRSTEELQPNRRIELRFGFFSGNAASPR